MAGRIVATLFISLICAFSIATNSALALDAQNGPTTRSFVSDEETTALEKQAPVSEFGLLYAAYTNSSGYMAVESDGSSQGAHLDNESVTAIEMHLGARFSGLDLHVEYCLEGDIENSGTWFMDGQWAGQRDGSGTAKSLRANISGTDSTGRSIAYRIYDGKNWSNWTFDGQAASTNRKKGKIVLFEVQIIDRGESVSLEDGFYTVLGVDGSVVSIHTDRSRMNSFPALSIESEGDGTYSIRSLSSGKYLVSKAFDTISWSSSKSNNALWRIYAKPVTSIVNANTGTALVSDTGRKELVISIAPPPSETPSTYVNIEVPAIIQNPELPTGCESVALTEALNYYGFDLPKTEIADNYMYLSSSDFVHSFMGNPHYGGGLAIMAPGIAETANRFLVEHKSSLRAYDITGTSFEDLYSYLEDDVPVVVWSTIGFSYPGGAMMYQEGFTMRTNTHCVTLSGYDMEDDTVLVADPLAGFVKRDRERFENIYILMGSQAVIIE